MYILESPQEGSGIGSGYNPNGTYEIRLPKGQVRNLISFVKEVKEEIPLLLQFIDDKVILSNPDLRRVPINVAIDDKGNHYVVTLTPLNDIGNKHLLRIAEIMGYVPQKPLQLHT